MTTLNKTRYESPLFKNFGYIQQYKRHLRNNALDGKTTCSCSLYCAENARYAEQIASVK
jgi:hypothetical protein